MIRYLTVFVIFTTGSLQAQFYTIDQSVTVEDNGSVLTSPWAGGLNSGQYSSIDLNNDGVDDLVVFDRTSGKISPFLVQDQQYIYAPEYIAQFPSGLRNWMLLRDFNCDGRKDIFTSHPFGMQVFINTSTDGALSWEQYYEFNNADPPDSIFHVRTQGFTSIINLQVNSSDIPAILDIDGDSDLDILVFRFAGNSSVELHQNMSMERNGNCDSLIYIRQTQSWGNFKECQCGVYAFNGEDCPPGVGGKVEHQGGKSMLILDADGDGDHDLVMSEEQCSQLYFFENKGDNINALFDGFTLFPVAQPVSLFIFPAAYYEDVDFDGTKDLIVAPNVAANDPTRSVNFQFSGNVWRNGGSDGNPSFSFETNSFLQSQMLDYGENASPAFIDYDGDGDLDMFVSSFVNLASGSFRASIVLFKNVGDAANPSFRKETDDYFSFSNLGHINVKIKFRDINQDGAPDLLFSSTSLNSFTTNIQYLLNTSSGGLSLDPQVRSLFNMGNGILSDNFEIFDIDADGLNDLLIGRSTGRLEYYRNIGSAEAPGYQLEDASFYGLDFSPFRQSPSVVIADIDADGTTDMLLGDDIGSFQVYNDFLSHLDNPLPPVDRLILNLVSETINNVNLGGKLQVEVTDIFNANKPSVVLGTGEGGVILLKNGEAISQPAAIDFKVYPNPLTEKQLLKITSKSNMVVFVISSNGKIMIEPFILKGNETRTFNLDNFAQGLYIVVGRNSGKTVSHKIVVHR